MNEDSVQDRRLLIVDWSNVMYRAWWSSQRDIELKPWIPILRFIDMLWGARRKTNCDEIIFAGESRTKLKRTEIDPAYKSKPKEFNNEFRAFRKACVDILPLLGYELVSIDGAEADDVIASIVAKNCHRCGCEKKCVNCKCAEKYCTDVFIFSNDKDLYQLLEYDRVYMYRSPGIVYSKEDFIDDYGFDPKYFDLYKAMIGDESDKIKGCEGFGPVKAKRCIIDNRVEQEVMLAEQEDQFDKALKLIRLDCSLDVPMSGNYVVLNNMTSREELEKAYTPQAVDEINLALIRLEAVFNE